MRLCVCVCVCVRECVCVRVSMCTHMCTYQDKITTAHRKCGKEVGEGGMKSNKPWEPGMAHSHTPEHKTRRVGFVVKGHIRKLYLSDL